MEFISKNTKETQKIAADLACKIIKSKKRAIIALEGELGAGKTVFVKGFAKEFGVKTKVKSPTFVLMKKYPVPLKNNKTIIKNIYHLDCYRINGIKELKIPEIKGIFFETDSVVLVEWPERIKKIIPSNIIKVHIDHVSENTREISVTSNF